MSSSPLRPRSNYVPPVGEDPLRPNGGLFFEEDLVRATLPETADVRRGLSSALASGVSGHHSGVALKAEVAGDKAREQQALRQAELADRRASIYAPRVSSLRDAQSIGDVGSFIAGAAPGVIVDTLPALAAGLVFRGRGRLAAPTALVGAAVPSYDQQFGEMAREQRLDPTLSKASADDRLAAARLGAAGGTILEAMLPGKLASEALRGPTRSLLRNTAADALLEGATETAQTGVQHLAHRTIDNTRELDGWDLIDSAVAGAVGGGGLSAAARAPAHGVQALADRFARGPEAAPVQEPPMGAAPPGTPLLPAPDDGSGGGMGGLFDTLNERFGPGVREQAHKAKDYVSDTIDRMGEAAKTAQSPSDFLRQVFGGSTEDAAAADLLHDTEDPGVMNSADPAAAMQQRDAERQERAAFFAEELLNDPVTPDAVKERVASFGGDFTDPEAQAFVARTLVAQRAGEKLTNAVNDLIDLTKDFGGKAAKTGTDLTAKARDMLDKSMTAAADRIVKKKNLQGGDEPGSGVTQFPTHRTRRTDRQQTEDFVESEFAAVVADQEKAVAEAEARVERAKRLNTGRMAEIVAVARTMPPEVFEDNPVYESMTPLERRAFHSIMEADEELFFERSVLNDMRKSLEPAKASSTTDRIVKKSLQGISLVDAKPLVDVLAQRLGPSGAAKAPELARQLLALSVRMSPEIRITPEVDSRLRSLSDAIDDNVLDAVTEVSGSDGLRQALARIREIPSAQTDVATSGGSSFLESMLVRPLPDGQRKQLALVIDEAGLQLKDLNPTRRNQLLTGLAAAFGSEENAQTVVEFYGNLRREAMQRDASRYPGRDDTPGRSGEDVAYEAPRPVGDAYEGTDDVAEYGTLPERDAPVQDTYYADPKSMRPFYEGREGRLSTEGGTRRRVRDIEAFMDRMQGRGVELRSQRYGDFLEERNEDSAAAVKRIRKDLEKRIAEGAPRKGEAAEYAEGRKKNRQYLEEQLHALNLIEKADGPEAAANLFSVAHAVGERNELGITDEQLAEADTLLRRTVDPKKRPPGMDWAQAMKHNRDIAKTKIVFKRHKGDPLALSAESLWKAYAKGQPAGRPMRQLFADAVSAVLNRPDIADLAHGLDLVLIDRASGTYADPQMSDEVREAKQELAHEYEARLSEAENRVEAATSEIEEARDEDRADSELVERIEVAADELQREADSGRITATALKDEAKSIKWEDGAPTPEAIELRARAAWEYDISRVFAEGARDLRETATEVRSELDRVEDGSNDAHTGNEFRRLERRRNDLQHAYDVAYDSGNEAAIEDAKRRLDAVGEAIKRMEAREAVERTYGSAGRTARAERGAAAKVRNYDESTGAALHPDDKPSAAKPKGLGKRLDAALLANPELLEVLDARGQPKDKAMTESRMRENLFKAYSAIKTPALKARLEGLRAKYQEAKNASNVGTPAARKAAKQEAAALEEIGQMVRWILEQREGGRTDTESAPKRDDATASLAALPDTVERVVDGTRVLYVKDADATKYIAGTRGGVVYVNMGKLRTDGMVKYLTEGPSAAQKQAVFDKLGITAQSLDAVLGNDKRRAAFLRDHELSHIRNKDKASYPRDSDGKPDPMHPDAIAIESRAVRDALSKEELAALGVGAKKEAPSRVILPITGRFTPKDQAKSDRANKFIGRGVPGSSTAAYAEAWGDRANVGEYSPEDTVFISANGKRPGALSPPWPEIKKAMSAGATLITDVPADRNNRSFNTGERAVADFLDGNGYVESAPGTWTPGAAARSTEKPVDAAPRKVVKKSFVGAKADPEGASDAEKLLGIGAPADVVWRDLGWFRGPDGKLRKEIRSPVLRRRVRDLATAIANGSRDAVKIRDLLEGIDAFAPYLDKLGDLPVDPTDDMVEIVGAVGAYNGEDGFFSRGIGISRENAELAVRVEAVPGGKGTDLLREIADSMTLEFVETTDLIAELEARHPMPDVNERVAEMLAGTILHELQHAFQHVEGFENGGNATSAVIAKYGDVDEYLAAIRDGDDGTVGSITEQAFAQLRAEVGPDGDVEVAAHKLYESIVGEVEANDVAARMKLSDEEAASLKPALMDAERKFVRSVLLAEALSTFRSKVGGRPGRPGKDWGDKDAVKAEILRLRGKDVKVKVEKLVKQLGGSGQYTYDPDTGERLIEVAINARSPVGTARHEAIHDLFRFLSENDATRSIAKDLRDATSAPHVIRQLRDLLKDHKAALEQLNDPEERAAYAYQFWAEGLLQIGPTGTGFFGTIRQFIKDLFGVVIAGQRGEDLLRAFHDGKFADPSTVQEVLQDINDSRGDRVSNKLNRAAPALTHALNALFSAAPDRLRRFENDYLNVLADKFQPESGTGFVQNRFQQEGVWGNRLGGILRGTTAVERREAIDQLQAMKPTSELAKKLAKFNDDIYEYMRDAGVQSWDSKTKKFVPLRKVQGYFTRSWDPDAIARNRTEFEALLRTEGGVSAANAAALVENLVRGSEKRPGPKESPVDLGFMPYVPHTAERVLTFINSNNADKFAKFQHKDLADIMTSYVRGSTHRAEYAREFGNNGEKIVDLVAKSGVKDPKELEEISNAVQALEGSLDPGNWSVQTKEAMSAVLTLQNATLLPLALVSQMIDPIVLAARTGDIKDAGTAYVTALKRLKNTITKSKNKVPGEELAEILGVVSEDSTLQAMAMAYGTTRMSKRMENLNRVFFKYNGMQGWNNSMRIAATAAGEKYLLAHRKDAKALAELGLEPKDIKSVGGKLDVSNPKVQQAMFQFVDQAVLRPSAANRPVWMSDPRFLLVAHLKQFTFAMNNVVMKRANRELQNDNPKPWGILMLAMPVILAADMAKFALTGHAPAGWGFKDYVLHAVARSGLLGLGDFGVQAMDRVDSGKMPGEGLLGPTFENLMKILRWIGGDPRTDFEDVVDRTVPGARFI